MLTNEWKIITFFDVDHNSVLKVEMATFTPPVQKHIGSQTSQ